MDSSHTTNVTAYWIFTVLAALLFAVLKEKFVRVSGEVQNRDGVVHLKAQAIDPLLVSAAEISSHDFH